MAHQCTNAEELIEEDLSSSVTEGEAFRRWRPGYHLIAPWGWMNDPCAPVYDPKTRLYHVAFQWNPKQNDWGDISWGGATSPDLVSWTVSTSPVLVPTTPYDYRGVFTGCARYTALNGEENGVITYFYTSVSQLPIHFTLNYQRGCETLSIATSNNGGASWDRYSRNPILPGPPEDLVVTGWRDPFATPWSSLSKFLGNDDPDALYGFISGGIHLQTPTTFLYSINPKNIAEWTYMGPLMTGLLNKKISKWSGDLGKNWEVTNMLSLQDSMGHSHEFLIIGSEGCLEPSYSLPQVPSSTIRTPRSQVWLSGTFSSPLPSSKTTSPKLEYQYSGVFDHGLLYAVNSFPDPISNHHIAFGWIPEEDLPDPLRHNQKWSGCLSLPRQVFLSTIPHVVSARAILLEDITCMDKKLDGDGTVRVTTLGIRPDPRLEGLRTAARQVDSGATLKKPMSLGLGLAAIELDVLTLHWELDCSISVGESCERVGLSIFHSLDAESETTISYSPQTSTLLISRPSLDLLASNVHFSQESAPHALLTSLDPVSKATREERLDIKIFYDNSVLEVFANERTVITTRLYTMAERCFGIKIWAEDGSEGSEVATIERCVAWDGLSSHASKLLATT
ncbi:putative beta-Fructufuranosidase [Halenospora varia]|nr:putative beta-Fructufuranosidase [Halenospora varia]